MEAASEQMHSLADTTYRVSAPVGEGVYTVRACVSVYERNKEKGEGRRYKDREKGRPCIIHCEIVHTTAEHRGVGNRPEGFGCSSEKLPQINAK